MRRVLGLCAMIALALLSGSPAAQSPVTAQATFSDLQGKPTGRATLTQMVHGVRIKVELTDLPSGWHGFHFHETASCEPPFASAGGHFNPDGEGHGFDSEGLHAGDLPNIFVSQAGEATLELVTQRVALIDDQPTEVGLLNRTIGAVQDVAGRRAHNVLSGNGTALIVHAVADDHRSQPAGNAGDRLACGVVTRQ